SWGKWRNYATTYGITQIKSQVGGGPTRQDIRTHISAEVNPSANFVLEHYRFYSPNNIGYLDIPTINFAAKVSFRGFGFESNDFYPIDNPSNYGLGGSNIYPTIAWGW